MKCMSKYAKGLPRDVFKKQAKELTQIIADKEKKSSSYKEGRLDSLSEEKTNKMKKFARDYIAKVMRKMQEREKGKVSRRPDGDDASRSASASATPGASTSAAALNAPALDTLDMEMTVEEAMDMEPDADAEEKDESDSDSDSDSEDEEANEVKGDKMDVDKRDPGEGRMAVDNDTLNSAQAINAQSAITTYVQFATLTDAHSVPTTDAQSAIVGVVIPDGAEDIEMKDAAVNSVRSPPLEEARSSTGTPTLDPRLGRQSRSVPTARA